MGYPGGKAGAGVYQRLINLMPPHRVYVEPFLGGGALMRLKLPAWLNIGIDLDPDAVASCASSIAASGDSAVGISGADDAGRWRWLVDDGISFLRSGEWAGDELVYCDPPYMHGTRARRDLYRHELGDGQHEELLSVLIGLPCMVMISGYWTQLYGDMLSAWSHISFEAMTRGGHTATEHVWYNYGPPLALHDYRYLGETFRERERCKRKRSRWVRRLQAMPILERQALLGALAEVGETPAGSPPVAMSAAPIAITDGARADRHNRRCPRRSPFMAIGAAAATDIVGDATWLTASPPAGATQLRRRSRAGPGGTGYPPPSSDRR
jgi:DNA adenine methylase